MTENEVMNNQKPSEMTENEIKTDIDEKKLTSKTDINGKKLITKPDFPTLFIKNVYDICSVKEAIRIILNLVVTIGSVEHYKNRTMLQIQ